MDFSPKIGLKIQIDDKSYEFVGDSLAPGLVCAAEGSQGTVYKIKNGNRDFAIKVLNDRFRTPSQIPVTEKIKILSESSGFKVADRVVINAKHHIKLLMNHPKLEYALLMPWIDGPNWVEIIAHKTDITKEDSLIIANAIVASLFKLEKQNYAHCDVAGTNIIVPYLYEKSNNGKRAAIEFIDIEDLYSEEFTSPKSLPKGTDGYNHVDGVNGIWNQYADRFSAAILLAEVLGWSNPEIRKLSEFESYFSADETQKPSNKYDSLKDDISKRWSNQVGDLLDKAWLSKNLQECPSIEDWAKAITSLIAEENIPDMPHPDEKEESSLEKEVFALQAKAFELEEQGEYIKAIELYMQIIDISEPDNEWIREIPGILNRLKSKASEDGYESDDFGSGGGPLPDEDLEFDPEFEENESHDKKVTESTTKVVYFAIVAFIGIAMFRDMAISLAENLSYQNQMMLAYGLVAGMGGMSQLLLLKFNVKNKNLWGALSIIGGMIIGYFMTYAKYLEYSPATQAFFFGGASGAVVGLAQTWLLDKDYQYLRKTWVGMSFVGWSFGWGLSTAVAWYSGTSIVNAIGAAIIIVFTGVAIDPIVRKVSGFEI